MKQDLMEKIALDLGFKQDKYYTAKGNMFKSCVGLSGNLGQIV